MDGFRHITIILPHTYRGGTLRAAKNIARSLKEGSIAKDRPIGIRLAVLNDVYDLQSDFGDLKVDGIEVREFSWKTISSDEVRRARLLQGVPSSIPEGEYSCPDDGVNNCVDSDLWFVISDRVPKPLAPIRPYILFATDYIQRYVPKIFGGAQPGELDVPLVLTARGAANVFVTTPQTGADAISYAGLPARKVTLAPMDFDPTFLGNPEEESASFNGFIWPTNTTIHKNHVRALEALEIYYGSYGGTLSASITGPETRYMVPRSTLPEYLERDQYIRVIRDRISNSKILRGNLRFLGELPDDMYAREIKRSKFMWHPTIYDNGTFAVTEAAYLSCPSLSSDYPQMKYIAEKFSIPMKFFSPFSATEMAKAIKDMEDAHTELRSKLPSRAHLEGFSWKENSIKYFELVDDVFARNDSCFPSHPTMSLDRESARK